jgi:hypothetical protein
MSSIIITLALRVVFSENPMVECGTKYPVGGCAYGNYIVIGYGSNGWDSNDILYHEVGHVLFLYDDEVKELISKYPAPRKYPDYSYPTDDRKLNEKVADYFLMYQKYPDFGKKFPEVKELFDLKISQLNK